MAEGGEDLYDYLRSIGMLSEDIEKLKNDKIDADALPLMSEEDIRIYIPHKGHRVLALGFCRKENSESDGLSLSKTKTTLLNRISEKMAFNRHKGKKTTTDAREKGIPNKGNTKPDRFVEIAWCNYRRSKGRYIQVKKTTGGGTRYPRMLKSAKKADIIKEARELFFPEGVSPKGNVNNFEMDVSLNVKGSNSLDDNITIGEIYTKSKVRYVRFYLSTTRIDTSSDTDSDNTEVLPRKSTKIDLDKYSLPSPKEKPIESCGLDPDSASATSVVPSTSFVTNTRTTSPVPSQDNAVTEEKMSTNDTTANTYSYVDDIANYDVESEVVIGAFDDDNPNKLDDTLPYSVFTVSLHRGQVLLELIEYFMQNEVNLCITTIEVQMVLPSGKLEAGEDCGGIMRDVLSEFWESFYMKHTQGNVLKVPILSHKMTSGHWKACAQVLAMGYKQEGYLPIAIAPPFLRHAIYGIREDHADLLDSFLSFVPDFEKELLCKALANFEDVDYDDIMEVLESHSVRTLPTPQNIYNIIREEIIQAPAFVADCWSEVLRPDKNVVIEVDLEHAIQGLTPNTKKVLKMLEFADSLTKEQNMVVEYLKNI